MSRPERIEDLENLCKISFSKRQEIQNQLDLYLSLPESSQGKIDRIEKELPGLVRPETEHMPIWHTYLTIHKVTDMLASAAAQNTQGFEAYKERLRRTGKLSTGYVPRVYFNFTRRGEHLADEKIQTIDSEFVEKIIGSDFEQFVGKLIPIIYYGYYASPIGIELRKEEIPLRKPIKILSDEYKNNIRPKLLQYMDGHRERLKTKLKQLKEQAEIIPSLKSDLSAINRKYRHIELMLQLNKNGMTAIRGKMQEIGGENYRGHFLHYGDEVLGQLVRPGICRIAFTTSSARPLKLTPVHPSLDWNLLQELNHGEFREGDFITINSGYRIFKNERVDTLFEKIETGIEIFPDPENITTGMREKKGIGIPGTGAMPDPRHWGQEYLGKIATGDIIEGELFATGLTYQAFPVNDLVVVEANQEGTATYIFDKDKFDALRGKPRSQIILEVPEGYKGRVLHGENHGDWISDLHEVIGDKRDD